MREREGERESEGGREKGREGERVGVKARNIDIEREGKRSQFNITLTQN